MKYFIVTFDRQPSVGYREFHDAFVGDERINRWSHFLKSSYLIGTEMSAVEVSLHFRSLADQFDIPKRHFVIRIDLGERSGWAPTKAWEWIKRQTGEMDAA